MQRDYDALVLDIDGTLLDDREQLHESTRQALFAARAAGVVVMLATGRSHDGMRQLAKELQIETPCVVFNGAALYDPSSDQLIARHELGRELVSDLLAHGEAHALVSVVARDETQYVRTPRAHELPLVRGYINLRAVSLDEIPRDDVMRVSQYSLQHPDSASLLADVTRVIRGRPAYCTHFPLSALAHSRDSTAQVVDVQAACDGKGEALHLLERRYGIGAGRVVAVGDALNDLPMIERAGLGVAMGNAMPELKRAARRVIGPNDSDAIALLVTELFLQAQGLPST